MAPPPTPLPRYAFPFGSGLHTAYQRGYAATKLNPGYGQTVKVSGAGDAVATLVLLGRCPRILVQFVPAPR